MQIYLFLFWYYDEKNLLEITLDIPMSIYRKISGQYYFTKYFIRVLKRVSRLGITSHIINFDIKSYNSLKHFKLVVNIFWNRLIIGL